MTHRDDNKGFDQVLEVLIENGLDGMASAMEVLYNEAMKIERSAFLNADSHERTPERRGYRNGFKQKKVKTRVGELDLAVPQVRNLEETSARFYPKSLEKGLRSERALKLAIAENWFKRGCFPLLKRVWRLQKTT